jgi:hypothetical protein
LIVAQQDLKIQKPVSVRSELSLFSTFSIAFTRERQHVRVLNYSRTVSAIVFHPPPSPFTTRSRPCLRLRRRQSPPPRSDCLQQSYCHSTTALIVSISMISTAATPTLVLTRTVRVRATAVFPVDAHVATAATAIITTVVTTIITAAAVTPVEITTIRRPRSRAETPLTSAAISATSQRRAQVPHLERRLELRISARRWLRSRRRIRRRLAYCRDTCRGARGRHTRRRLVCQRCARPS